MRLKQQIFFILLVFTCLTLSGQKVEPLDYYKSQFPNDEAVILGKKEIVYIDLDDNGLSIKIAHKREKLFLSDKRPSYADEFIFSHSFMDIENIDAVYYIPSGKRYRKYRVTDIKTSNEFSANVFFDDRKVKHIVFPKVIEGSKSTVSYDEIIFDPHFLGAYYFSTTIPIINSELSVIFPPEVKVKYAILNNYDKLIDFTIRKKKGKIIYTWKARNIESIDIEKNAPSVLYYIPHVILYIDEYEYKGENHKVLSDINQLYNWYYSLLERVNTEVDLNIKEITDSLIIDAHSDIEKVKKIYYWVQDNIRYIAFEDGLGGFIPENASNVCSKRYGDCKGMASLLSEMLKIANIQVYLTWIGTRAIPYSYSEVPTPQTDNHMIATINLEDSFIFLDATARYMPFGLPGRFIQGKEALIGLGKDSFEIIKVPILSRHKNTYRDSINLKVEKEELKGSGKAFFKGYFDVYNANGLIDLSEEKQDEYVNGRLRKGNNKCRIDSFSLYGLENRDENLVIDYRCTIPDYIKNIEGKLYINMNLNKVYYNDNIDVEKRKIDRKIDSKSTRTYVTVIEIPHGYFIENLPDDSEYISEEFGFKINYYKLGDKLLQKKEVIINTLMIKREQFSQWNEMIDKLNDAYRQVVVLKIK